MPSLSLAQEQSIAWANRRLNVWEGATRGGKTVSSLLAWLAYVAHAPEGELFMFGRTRDTVGRNSLLPLQTPAITGSIANQVHYTLGAPVAHILGRRVHVFGANDVQAEAKVRGGTFAGGYGDELTLVPKAFFTQALGRLSVDGSRMFGTTNPGAQAHWLRTDFLLRADEPGMDVRSFHFTLDDNPSLTEAYKASIRAEYTGMFFKRFVEGIWCNAEGAVFEQFDTDRHVVDVCPAIKRWLGIGIDYGSVNPFAAVVLGLGVDRRLYIVAEWYWDSKARMRQLTDVEYASKLAEFVQGVKMPATQLYGIDPEYIVVDPSAASFRQQLWREHWPVKPADNAVLDGIRLMSSLLTTGRLKIHRSCVNLIRELQGYVWDDKAAEKGDDKPVKQADHAVDGCRYILKTTHSLWRNAIIPAPAPVNAQDRFMVGAARR